VVAGLTRVAVEEALDVLVDLSEDDMVDRPDEVEDGHTVVDLKETDDAEDEV